MRSARTATITVTVALLLIGSFVTLPAVAATGGAQGPPGGGQLFIVGFHGDPPAQRGGQYQGATVLAVNTAIDFIQVQAADAPGFEQRARADAGVRYVERDYPDIIKPLGAPNDPRAGEQWGWGPTPGIDAYNAWDVTTGSTGVIVAVLDTGLDKGHEDIGNYLQGYDFAKGDNDPEDKCGHGTHVAGTVGALTNNGVGVAGTAQTTILPVKVLDKGGAFGGCSGSFTAVANGITYAADRGAKVISMSLGCDDCSSQAVRDALKYAVGKGALNVASAGNSGGKVGFPANDPNAMAISALTKSGSLASYSARGPEIELAAPGSGILSTVPGGYSTYSGTSMAAPHVSGTAALVIAAGGPTGGGLRSHLKSTATDTSLSASEEGAGNTNACTAVGGANCGGAATTNSPPTARFTHTTTDLTVNVDGSGSSDSDGTIQSYAWDFGDGATGSGATASHTYAAAGDYTVRLTVTDDKGATGTTSKAITVASSTPTANAGPDQTVSDADGTGAETVTLDGTGSTAATGRTLTTYEWFEGATLLATGATADVSLATGAHTVTLKVTDDQGATDTDDVAVTVNANQAPTARFTHACTELACSFDASASSDPDGAVASYAWDFNNDGTVDSTTGPTVSHTFPAAGTYTVKLTITDNGGATASAQKSLTVGANQAPTAAFTVSCSGLTCSFDGSASSDPEGGALTYAWDFDNDGTVDSTGGPTVSHTYATGGDYTARLTVTDNGGATGTTTESLRVNVLHVHDIDHFLKGNRHLVVKVWVHNQDEQPVSGVEVTVNVCKDGDCSLTLRGTTTGDGSVDLQQNHLGGGAYTSCVTALTAGAYAWDQDAGHAAGTTADPTAGNCESETV